MNTLSLSKTSPKKLLVSPSLWRGLGGGFLAAALILLSWGCSSSDDDETKPSGYILDTVTTAPTWQIPLEWTDAPPSWQEPDVSNYDSWYIIVVTLQSELATRATNDDLMAVFFNDNVRAVAQPALHLGGNPDGKVTFILKVFGDINDYYGDVSLKYYNAQLKNTFIINTRIYYEEGKAIGITDDYVADFLYQGTSSRFPTSIQRIISIDTTSLPDFVSTPDDMVAAFVGNECRGVARLSDMSASGKLTLCLHTSTADEKVTLRYYSAAQNKIFTMQQPIAISGDDNIVIKLSL